MNVSRKPVVVDVNRPDACVWECEVHYGKREHREPETGDAVISFDTTGGTQHITQSLGTKRYARAGEEAPDFRGAIGVTESGVQGVDITVPVYAWTETHYLEPVIVDEAYRRTVRDLTGRVNLHRFRGYDSGEVLFRGATGTRRGLDEEDDWAITYHFAASENRDDIEVADIGPIVKGGWEYLWTLHAPKPAPDGVTLLRVPKAVYVEKTSRDGDFSQLAIGRI